VLRRRRVGRSSRQGLAVDRTACPQLARTAGTDWLPILAASLRPVVSGARFAVCGLRRLAGGLRPAVLGAWGSGFGLRRCGVVLSIPRLFSPTMVFDLLRSISCVHAYVLEFFGISLGWFTRSFVFRRIDASKPVGLIRS